MNYYEKVKKQNAPSLDEVLQFLVEEENAKARIAGIDDGGSRVHFPTGATRECQDGKGRYDLISPIGLKRLARWYELGAQKYEDRGWEKGLPVSNCLNSLFRHLVKYLDGQCNEDHLAAIAWNAFAVMHFEESMPEMMDVPSRFIKK